MGCELTLNLLCPTSLLIFFSHGFLPLTVEKLGPHWASWADSMLIWNTRRNRLGSAYMLRTAKECGGAQGRNNRPRSKGVDLLGLVP